MGFGLGCGSGWYYVLILVILGGFGEFWLLWIWWILVAGFSWRVVWGVSWLFLTCVGLV